MPRKLGVSGERRSGRVRVAVVGAARTPIGKFRGALRSVPAVVLGQVAMREALKRAAVEPTSVNEVLFGCGIQAGLGQNPARQVARGVGIPDNVGSVTVNKVCGSGMKATTLGAAEIIAGDLSLAVVGGMESMDLAPHLQMHSRDGVKYGDAELRDSMLWDSLIDAYDHRHMGMAGEDVARRYRITREDADRFALRSNQRAIKATDDGTFRAEMAPIPASVTGTQEMWRDEGPRADTNMEKLSKLRPAFDPKGVLTAGNSSQLSDGAAALVLASAGKVEELGLKPLAWIHSYHTDGLEPSRVMESPIPTVKGHLARESFGIDDIDLFEHNEAFSTASIAVQRELKIPEEKFNVNGGAVALGHPVGCSGARVIVTLLYAMKARHAKRGLATLCMGGGNGMSVILESAPRV